MNEHFREKPEYAPNVMAELHAALGELHATGAMDEEGPFVANLMRQVEEGKIDPTNALLHLRAKLQSRNEYH